MARRKKKISLYKVHDFTGYVDPPIGQSVSPIEVDDPYSRPGQTDKIRLLRQTRDDPLGEMHANHFIDDAQFTAGRRWQACYEQSRVAGWSASKWIDCPVDGGGGAYGFTDAQLNALRQLREASKALGPMGDSIIRDVLGEGRSIKEIARRHGDDNQSGYKGWGFIFRKSLEILAFVFGKTSAAGTNAGVRWPDLAIYEKIA